MAYDLNTQALTDSLAFLSTTFPAGAILEVRTGSAPGQANAATGTLLISYTLPATPWGTASGGARALAAALTGTATGTGTAGWFRLKNTADTARLDGVISTVAAATGDLQFDNTSITTGQTVAINTFSVGATDNQP